LHRALTATADGNRLGLSFPGSSETDDHGRWAVKGVSVAAPKKYPDELRERAVRLYRESDPKPVIRRLAEQLGVHHEALRNWIRQDQADHGERHDRPATAETEELRVSVRRTPSSVGPTKSSRRRALFSPRRWTRQGAGIERGR
jgi:transposase-like protein